MIYLPPVITSIAPISIPYQKGNSVTVMGTNFGTRRLFDGNGIYIGPVGETPVDEYKPPSVFVVMDGGATLPCVNTEHISNGELVCKTPEMTSMNVSVVSHVVGQRSRAWVPGSILTVQSLPRYKYDCPMEKSGRCFDCCEAECQFQVCVIIVSV